MNFLAPGQVLSIFTKRMGIKLVVLRQRWGDGVIRGMAAELIHKYCALSQSQIGMLLGGIDYGAV